MRKTLFPAIVVLIVLIALVFGVGKFVFQPESSPGVSGSTNQPANEHDTIAIPSVYGRVIVPDGRAIEDATVFVRNDHSLVAETRSDAKGYFQVDDLVPGNYWLSASAPGYILPELSHAKAREIVVPVSPQKRTTHHLILQKPSTIKGKITATGRPVQDARLSLYYLFAESISGDILEPYVQDIDIRSDEKGHFELLDIAPGRLRILVQAADFAFAESDEIYLRGGDIQENIHISLSQGSTLKGAVVSANGDAINATVILNGPTYPRGERQVTNRRGGYVFQDIPGGNYTLEVHAQGYRTEVLRDIYIEDGDIQTHDVILEEASGLFGKVVDGENRPVPNARVIFRSGDERHELRARPDGTFQWDDAPDQRWTAQAITTRHAPSSQSSIYHGQELILRLGNGAYINGLVMTQSGHAVTSFVVAVESIVVDDSIAPAYYSPRAISPDYVNDAGGNFRFGPLRPGTYKLRVYSPDHAPGISDEVILQAGRDAHGVIIRVGEGATLSGVVLSESDGTPVSGAQVMLFEPTAGHPPKRTRTDHNGRYTLEGLPAGRRSLRVTHADYLTELAAGIDVPKSGAIRRDIRLAKRQQGERFSFHGIGAVLGQNEKGVEISQINEGGPAELFGLEVGDIILEVDGNATKGHTLTNIVERIRGQEGSVVSLEIERRGEGRFVLEVERGRVVVKESTN